MRKLLLAGVMILAVAAVACSKKADKAVAPPGGEAAGAAGAGGAAPSADAGVFAPRQKEGLWQLAMQSNMGPAVSGKVCVDAATAGDFSGQAGQDGGKCDKPTITRKANGWDVVTNCTTEGQTMSLHSTITGDMSSNYVMDMQIRQGDQAQPLMTNRIEAKWLGPCPEGFQPGKMKVEGMNLGG